METERKAHGAIESKARFLQKIAELCVTPFSESTHLFDEIIKAVGQLLHAKMVCLSEIQGPEIYFKRLLINGEIKENAGHCPLKDTPCATVNEHKEVRIYSEVGKKFPKATLLQAISAKAYCGIPCLDSKSNVRGVLCIIDDRKRTFSSEDIDLIMIFGSRIGMEMERQTYVSQKNAAEIEVREREKKYRTLIQTASDAIMTIDVKVGIVLEANRNAEKLMGRINDEVIGHHMDEFYPAEISEKFRQLVKETLEKGAEISKELFLLHKSGRKIPVEVSTNIINLFGKDVIQCLFRDLTDRKKAEKEIRKNLRRFEDVVSVSPAIVYQCRIEKNRFVPIYVSSNIKELWGYEEHEYLNNPHWWFNNVHPDDRDIILSLFPYKLYRYSEYKHEYRFRDKGGNYRWVYDHIRLVKNREGMPYEVVGSWLDISERRQADEELHKYREYLESLVEKRTGALKIINEKLAVEIEERKRIEKALRESEERYRLFVEEFHGITFQYKLGNGMIFLNGAVEEITGYTEEEFRRGVIRLDQIFHPEDKKRFYKGSDELLTTCKKRVKKEYRIIRKNGEVRWVEEIIQNLCDEKGKPVKAQGTICDITEKKNAEEDLKEARKKAETANLAKSTFIASLSHEIRTPLQTIIGMSEELENAVETEEESDYVKSIITASDNILRLINNVLDFSKIESGKFELEEIDFNLSEIINQSSEIVAFQARQKGLFFQKIVNDDIPLDLRGDPMRLRQIIINLLSNAVKFTKKGGLSLTVEKRAQTDQILTLLFSVSDTGIGIPPDKRDKVFRDFTQADRSTSRLFGGTGLGTTISKELVEMMGGKMGLKSRKGKGSTFFFTVPFKLQSRQEGVALKAGERVSTDLLKTSLSMLLVEDSEDIQNLFRVFLKDTAVKIDSRNNGKEGLEAFKSGNYDLIMMDIEMPVMNGLAACRKMRQWEKEKGLAPRPIVAITAHAFVEEVKEILAAGFNEHLSKPVKKDNLLKFIKKFSKQ